MIIVECCKDKAMVHRIGFSGDQVRHEFGRSRVLGRVEQEQKTVIGIIDEDPGARTAFEVVDYGLGAQNAVAAGGRYDNLIEEMGGHPTPAIGFAAGCERLVLCLKERQSPAVTTSIPDLLLAAVGLSSEEYPVKLLQELRRAGLSVLFDWEKRGIKAQLKLANRCSVKQALILGQDELDRQVAILKDMETGKQEEIALEEIIESLQQSK